MRKPDFNAAVGIDAAALWGMLSDLVLSAGRDAWLPMLNGVVLHTATDPAGNPVLVGTSTDRFMLGQAHEPIGPGGSLPLTFMRLTAVRALLTVLAPLEDDESDDDEGDPDEPDPAVLSVADNTLTLTHAGQSIRVAASPDWSPGKAVAGLLGDAEAVNRPACVAGAYLGVLATIAGRRGDRVGMTVQQPDRPIHVHIGERYRALVMPLKQDSSTALAPPPFFPPVTNRQAAA